MTELTVEDVLAWMSKASNLELEEIADEVVDRDLAVSAEDYAALNSEYQALAADEQDETLLGDAADRLRRREYSEALHALANALGRDFYDLDTIPLRA